MLTATTLGVLSGMAGSYARNVRLIGQVRDALDAYPAGPLPADAGEAAFYAKALQRFDALAQARDAALPPGASIPWSRRFGLHQGTALARDVQKRICATSMARCCRHWRNRCDASWSSPATIRNVCIHC